MSELKSKIKSLSKGDAAYLNGFDGCGLADNPVLLYDVIVIPNDSCLGLDHTSSWREMVAEELNAMTTAEFEEFADDVWNDSTCYPKLGAPGAPIRIVRPT